MTRQDRLTDSSQCLAPAVVHRRRSRSRRTDLKVRVRRPGNGTVVLADVLILNRSVSWEVDRHCT
jgi:hypothetical protein